MSNNAILQVQNVNRTFTDDDGNVVQALSQVNLAIERNEFVSVIGSSGCGKTTLLRLIAGLDKPQSGDILLDGNPIDGTDPQRGYVFQQGSLFPWLTVEDNIAYGLKARGVYKKNKERIQDFVDLIGLTGFEKSYPHQISGGMAQRVAIARALINDPEILLLDEPMGALDSFTRADIQDKLLELKDNNNTTMFLVTHDVDEALYLSDRIVIMTPRPGRISEILDVSLPHPRNRSGEEFTELRNHILERFHLASSEESSPEYII